MRFENERVGSWGTPLDTNIRDALGGGAAVDEQIASFSDADPDVELELGVVGLNLVFVYIWTDRSAVAWACESVRKRGRCGG